MRRWSAAVTVGIVLAITSTTGALAARPTTFEEDFTSFECQVSDGDASGFVFVRDSSVFGPVIEVAIDGAFGFSDDPADVRFEDGSVAATVELLDAEGMSLGDAVLDASFAPIGDVERFNDIFRDGNVRFHDVGSFQNLEVGGTLTALGSVFDLGDCFGATGHVTSRVTSPDAFVAVSRDVSFLTCSFDTADDFVFLFAFADRFGAGADLDTSAGFGFAEDAVFTADGFSASFELLDPETGEPTGLTATADATLTAQGPPETFVNGHSKRVARVLEVDGTLSIPGIGELDLSACEAEHVINERFLRTTPNVRPPANDLPEDAIPISTGDRVRARTGGAAPLGEVRTDCLAGAPPGFSVWYTLAGTGDAVTLDPTGSNFDTVIAVYTREGDTFTEIACIDDDEDLAGALTFDTEVGVTYWVQVGGFFEDFGTLTLAVG